MSLSLLHPPSDVVRWGLVALGTVTNPTLGLTWPGYHGVEPDLPDECVIFTGTSPIDHGSSMTDGEGLQHYGFQVRVRGVTDVSCYTKADAIRKAINETFGTNRTVTIDGTSYIVYGLTHTNVIPLGLDRSNTNRYIYTLNATASLDRIA